MEGISESVVIRSLKRFRDKYLLSGRRDVRDDKDEQGSTDECLLNALPVDMQFHIMAFLSPQDLCRLGGTGCYWRWMVRDPLLWRYFLLRDIPLWPSIDHTSMPRLSSLDTPICEGAEGSTHDFMADYVRASPVCRHRGTPTRPSYRPVTSFLQSLVPSTEPRFALFGPGLEELDVSLVTTLMHSPGVLPVAGIPQRQIDGIGSGISFMFDGQHRLNILTLYSSIKRERDRARVEHHTVQSKLFIQDGRRYSLAPQVQEVCRVVDGFIYAANAQTGKAGGREQEHGHIQAMLDPLWGSSSRPLLVLSCISRAEPGGARTRTPSVHLAQQLSLTLITNPWMVQDVVAESLAGLSDSLGWLLERSGLRL